MYLAQADHYFYELIEYELSALRHMYLSWSDSSETIPTVRPNFLKAVPPLESLPMCISAAYRDYKSTSGRVALRPHSMIFLYIIYSHCTNCHYTKLILP